MAANATASRVRTIGSVGSMPAVAGEGRSSAGGPSRWVLAVGASANATRSSADDAAGVLLDRTGLADGSGVGLEVGAGLGFGVGFRVDFAVAAGFGFAAGAFTVVLATGCTDTHFPSQAMRTLP